jgi:hypothetical protein
MSGTGLASVIAKAFVAIATPATLALWSFLSSLIITLLIPSAGRHWGRARAVRPACGARLARTRCAHRYGCGNGRKRVEHAAAFLGRSSRGNCGHSHSARHGLYRDHICRLTHHLRDRALVDPPEHKTIASEGCRFVGRHFREGRPLCRPIFLLVNLIRGKRLVGRHGGRPYRKRTPQKRTLASQKKAGGDACGTLQNGRPRPLFCLYRLAGVAARKSTPFPGAEGAEALSLQGIGWQ